MVYEKKGTVYRNNVLTAGTKRLNTLEGKNVQSTVLCGRQKHALDEPPQRRQSS